MAADGRVHVHPLEFGGRLVQPPHRAAADRHVVEIGDQERAVAGRDLRAGEGEMRGTWFGKRRLQFRVQRRDQPARVGRGQRAAADVEGPHALGNPSIDGF